MQRALSLSGLVVAALVGALISTAWRFPVPRSIADWLTSLVAFATIGQAFFALFALEGVKHAREQASAAKSSIDVAQDTARRQLRAYVGISESGVRGIAVGSAPTAVGLLKNYGTTPATSVTAVYHTRIAQVAPGLELEPLVTDASPSKSVLGPNDAMKIAVTLSRTLTEVDLGLLRSGSAAIYFWGVASYEDIFGNRQETRFQHMSNGGDQAVALQSMSVCDIGNDMT